MSRGIFIVDMDYIIRKIKNRKPKPMDVKYKYAILVPMIEVGSRWELIFEVRAKDLKRQPGEISFPGGKVEKDETYKEAAIRETVEELNIAEERIKVIGELDYLVSYNNSTIRSFLATIHGINVDNMHPNKSEVDHLFTVPLEFFIKEEPNVYFLDLHIVNNRDFPYSLIPNGEDYDWQQGKHSVYFYRYGDYVIWGYTAKVIKHFMDIIKSH
mgnify:FL=1